MEGGGLVLLGCRICVGGEIPGEFEIRCLFGCNGGLGFQVPFRRDLCRCRIEASLLRRPPSCIQPIRSTAFSPQNKETLTFMRQMTSAMQPPQKQKPQGPKQTYPNILSKSLFSNFLPTSNGKTVSSIGKSGGTIFAVA